MKEYTVAYIKNGEEYAYTMNRHEYLQNDHFCTTLNYYVKSSLCTRDIDNVYFNKAIISINDIYTIYKQCVAAFNDKYYKSFDVKTENIPVKIPVVFDIDTVELIERIIIKLSIRVRR